MKNERFINDQIRVHDVRVVGDEGQQLGVMPTRDALAIAEEKGLDLVMVAPEADPPVCRIMDFGKFRFEQAKRQKEARKNQKVITLKEVQLSVTIEDHDVQIKARNAIRFLEDGDKVKVSLRFRGRQISHPEIGTAVMKQFVSNLEDIAVIERNPLLEGRTMIMILAPNPKAARNQEGGHKDAKD